ncbi:MAG TPA: oxidative damage protection protein [Gammaproteobacteria bacterium]|nr:oxidative damage protection protein [Gammaproteobacteria bacterium]
MTRTVHCVKLGTEAEGLDFVPWPGELGQRIFAQVSKQAWQEWQQLQTMLINECRINAMDPAGRKLLAEKMEQYFFSDEEIIIPGISGVVKK